MEDFPWTPHTAVWNPRKDGTRGGTANDGKVPSLVPGATLACFIEPKSARWAAEKYGVEADRQPFLLILNYDDGAKLVKGDVLTFRDEPLELYMTPQLHDYGDGFRHAETMLLGKRTGVVRE